VSGVSLVEALKAFGVRRFLRYIDADPEKRVLKAVNWLLRFSKDNHVAPQLQAVRNALQDPENNWCKLGMSFWTDIDDGVRHRVLENFVVNAGIIGLKRQDKIREEHGCNVPWAILMDPTSACNLHCEGCWAADYGSALNMSFDTLNHIVEQGKELGVYFYIFSGGEPLVRKDDVIRLCETHGDCVFMAFTNGTLIDEGFADEMLRVQNFVPAISVEGFEESTDSRRGRGTYQAVMRAMDVLRSKKLLFGVSCCYTSENTYTVGSEEFFDHIIDAGAKFAWFFTYMPVGVNASPELIASADQREFMCRQIRRFRQTKPIFTLDFWNDGEYSGGCIAGGRKYLHINANGDIEPCAFIHYSDSNICEKTLLEALKSPLFMEYRTNQPFNCNHLRPCPLLDNPEKLAEMVERTGARSTDLANPEDVRDLASKCVGAAEAWAIRAEALWEEFHRDNAAGS
jgi:MoaA/NifB/PqqE/SkfB family radical SAM enzyme